MIRTPLRPLARILRAREKGENPDAIEAENRAQRHAQIQERARGHAQRRLLFMSCAFAAAFAVVGVRIPWNTGRFCKAAVTELGVVLSSVSVWTTVTRVGWSFPLPATREPVTTMSFALPSSSAATSCA